MKKLCLILTVLYAIWANCSAQSLNIAGNLLDSNSSTFESGMGSWTCYDNNNACSIVSESGRNGKCLKLTNTGAGNDWDKQMEYSLSGHTPAKGTTYVIKFWAKRNGDSGNGNIKVLLQKNNPDGSYPQIAFGGKSIPIADTWSHYEYELTTDRDDYQVIKINFGNCGEVLIDDIEFGVKTYNVINVEGKDRRYWLYVPASVAGKTNVPVIFSLHGRQDKGADPDKTDAPKFKDIADTKGVIIVYPQGRNGNDQDYPNRTENGKEVAWNSGYAGNNYGWEATGQENADTKFIQALVDELKKNNFYGSTTVDPTRFYLCGFSMGGMMTYACAKVLNGTFAAYGSCGGYPLNEFHLNLATKQPVPFIHLHGNNDNGVGINHLHTIIENLLFRNGCNLANYTVQGDLERDGFKKYDFTGVNGVPVTTVTFNELGHAVAPSAPDYLWNFFKDKMLGTYTTTTMKWQWDMKTINGNLGDTNGNHYGWNRVQIAGGNNGTLTYGDNRKNNDNHNVYNSIQLEKGTYKLHAKANVVSSDATGIIVGIYKVGEKENSGKCIIRRQVKNNSGEASADLSILYPFAITEDGEYYVKVERGNNQNTCTALAIHTNEYAPTEEDDSEAAPELTSGWENDGLIVKIDFEEEGKDCAKIGEEMTATNHTDNFSFVKFKEDAPKSGYKLYNLHRADNIQTWDKSAVIQKDEIFGYYFQNIPKAQFYDRSARQNYMRAVYNPQNEMFNNRKTKRYIFKTKRIFFVSPSIMQIM